MERTTKVGRERQGKGSFGNKGLDKKINNKLFYEKMSSKGIN